MSGGWGRLPEVCGGPAHGVERGMGGRQGLSACSKRNAAGWQAEKTLDREGKCVSSQWESLCSQG